MTFPNPDILLDSTRFHHFLPSKVLFNKDSFQSVDTALEGEHFFNWMEPKDIAYRSVAIALSDLAACGASPSWFMLSITLKDKSKDWLTSFRQGLIDVSDEFKIPLIGGDTTRGGLSITVHVGGIVAKERKKEI